MAALWALAGVSKLSDVLTQPESAGNIEIWASQFPLIILVSVILLEIFTALLLIVKPFPYGFGIGIGLLAMFSIVVLLFPPTEAQTCGCLGDLASLRADTMHSRIAFLMGIHAISYALYPWCNQRANSFSAL